MQTFTRSSTYKESGILRGSIDWHSHILYGVDDGIKTIEESLATLAFEEAIGITDIWCTPHIMEEVPSETDMLKERFGKLVHEYSGMISLHLGAEYMMDGLLVSRLSCGDIITMGHDMILVEFSCAGAPYGYEEILSGIMSEGLRPMLAHPERYPFLSTDDYRRLHEMGVLFQLNLASLTGWYGKDVRKRAESLLRTETYHVYGSDCHSLRTLIHQYSQMSVSRDMLRRVASLDDNI